MAADDRFDLTGSLLERVQAGDPEALDRLVAQVIAMLEHRPAGRLVGTEHDADERYALVRGVVLDVIRRTPAVELRSPGGLQLYLLQAAAQRIDDQARRRARRAGAAPRDDASSAHGPLWQLPPVQRDAIVARIERQASRHQHGAMVRTSNIDAARAALHRALRRLGARGPKRPA